MKIVFSDRFKEDLKKLKDETTEIKILKQIRKLERLPESGKPLRYNLKNYRVLRVHPFRIIYSIEGDTIIIHCFEHRKDIYE